MSRLVPQYILAFGILGALASTPIARAWSLHMAPGPQAPLSECLCPKTSVWDATTKTCSRNKLMCRIAPSAEKFCGCDGKTYPSACAAALAGVRLGQSCSAPSAKTITQPRTILTATMKDSNVLLRQTFSLISGQTVVFTATPEKLRGLIAMDWNITNQTDTGVPANMCEKDGWNLICTPQVKAITLFDVTVSARLLGKSYPSATTIHMYAAPSGQ